MRPRSAPLQKFLLPKKSHSSYCTLSPSELTKQTAFRRWLESISRGRSLTPGPVRSELRNGGDIENMASEQTLHQLCGQQGHRNWHRAPLVHFPETPFVERAINRVNLELCRRLLVPSKNGGPSLEAHLTAVHRKPGQAGRPLSREAWSGGSGGPFLLATKYCHETLPLAAVPSDCLCSVARCRRPVAGRSAVQTGGLRPFYSMPRLLSRFFRLSMSDRAFAMVEAIDRPQSCPITAQCHERGVE